MVVLFKLTKNHYALGEKPGFFEGVPFWMLIFRKKIVFLRSRKITTTNTQKIKKKYFPWNRNFHTQTQVHKYNTVSLCTVFRKCHGDIIHSIIINCVNPDLCAHLSLWREGLQQGLQYVCLCVASVERVRFFFSQPLTGLLVYLLAVGSDRSLCVCVCVRL